MQNLLNGSQFQRLNRDRNRKLHERLNLESIDIQTIRNINKGKDYTLLHDLIKKEILDDKELAESIGRLHKQKIIEFVRLEDDIHTVAFKLTHVGKVLKECVTKNDEYAIEVMLRGMTEEQAMTFERLSQMVAQNVDKEMSEKQEKIEKRKAGQSHE